MIMKGANTPLLELNTGMGNTTVSIPKLPYQQDYFVNRDYALDLIQNRIKQAQSPTKRIFLPLIKFWGMPGVGKTWLLKHVCQQYSFQKEDERPFCPIYCDLEKLSPDSIESEDTFVLKLTQTLIDEVRKNFRDSIYLQIFNDKLKEQASISQNLYDQFIATILFLTKKIIFIFLLDTNEKVNNKQWQAVEKDLLELLIESDLLLMIVAGRRHEPSWHRIEVRRRLTPIEETKMIPFSLQSLQKQLQKDKIPIDIEGFDKFLLTCTAGIPWLTYLLTKVIMQKMNSQSSTKVFDAQAYEDDIKQVLIAYEQDVLNQIDKDNLRRAFDVLLPLRFYRVDALRFGLNQQDNSLKTTDVELLIRLRQLASISDIVWWDNQQSKYITDPVVRKVLSQLNWIRDKEKYINQHQIAIQFYTKRINQSKNNSTIYLLEFLYHQAILYEYNQDDQILFDVINTIFKIATDDLSIEERDTLQNKFTQDVELQELLPPAINQQINYQLNQLIKDEENV